MNKGVSESECQNDDRTIIVIIVIIIRADEWRGTMMSRRKMKKFIMLAFFVFRFLTSDVRRVRDSLFKILFNLYL
jgi:hypothetical protein